MKYINIVGGPGSGKSTAAKVLAKKLGLEYIELDEIQWQIPNWEPLDDALFIQQAQEALDASPGGWVVDGSYHEKLGGVVRKQADTVVFLRISLIVSVPRVIRRSFNRIVQKQLLWGVNYETPKGAANLVWWTIKYHRRRIKKMNADKKNFSEQGIAYKEFRSNRAAQQWIEGL